MYPLGKLPFAPSDSRLPHLDCPATTPPLLTTTPPSQTVSLVNIESRQGSSLSSLCLPLHIISTVFSTVPPPNVQNPISPHHSIPITPMPTPLFKISTMLISLFKVPTMLTLHSSSIPNISHPDIQLSPSGYLYIGLCGMAPSLSMTDPLLHHPPGYTYCIPQITFFSCLFHQFLPLPEFFSLFFCFFSFVLCRYCYTSNIKSQEFITQKLYNICSRESSHHDGRKKNVEKTCLCG